MRTALLLLVLLSLAFVAAENQRVYTVQIEIGPADRIIGYQTAQGYATQPDLDANYVLEVRDADGILLEVLPFIGTLDIVSGPDARCFDENMTYDPECAPLTGSLVRETQRFNFQIPFRNEGYRLVLATPEGVVLDSVDISGLARTCGDAICTSDESTLSCPQDCGQPTEEGASSFVLVLVGGLLVLLTAIVLVFTRRKSSG